MVRLSKITAGKQSREQRPGNSVTNDNLFCRRLQNYGQIDDGASLGAPFIWSCATSKQKT